MIKIKRGQVIAEAGQYDMPMDWYHSQCCAGPSVSSSGLRKIYHQSPADFWAFSDLNDNRFEDEGSEAFTFGRAAHSLLLGDEDFNANFAIVPKTAPPKPLASQIAARLEGRITPAAQERFDFWDDFEVEHEGKEYLSQSDLQHIEQIAKSLSAHEIVPVLMDGQAEQSLIWQDEKTGLWLKSRLDILSATGDLADLKTTIQRDGNLLLRDTRKHGYDMQLGLATMAVEQVLGIPFDPETYAGRSAILLFVYKKPPYHVMPVELDYDALYWGRIKCRKAIDTMAECIMKDHWPGPTEGILTYTSEYEVTQLMELQAAGALPNDM